MKGWQFLLLAILLEVSGTICMKLSDGFSRLVPSVALLIFYCASIISLTMALKTVQIGTAYAIWSGLGTALISIAGFLFFKDAVTILKVSSLILIIIGIVGLRLSSN